MNVQEILEKMKCLQNSILIFLDNQDKNEENFQNLTKLIVDSKIRENQKDITMLFKIIVQIADDHHRCPDFFDKIEQILHLFKDAFKKFKNSELFEIFKSNLRILLFLFEEKIIIVDECIVDLMVRKSENDMKWLYYQYFFPEINSFEKLSFKDTFRYYFSQNEKEKEEEEEEEDKKIKNEVEKLPEDYYKKRKLGVNESHVCELIRNDSIVEFIVFVNENNLDLNSFINYSIYETNLLLLQDHTTLIQYAAFYGSIRIFKYLVSKKVELVPSLWIYAIHSNNGELISILEENEIKPRKGSYKKCFIESIKCHHNEIAYHIENSFLDSPLEDNSPIFKYYNFEFINYNDLITNKSHCLYDLICCDYCNIVDLLLKNVDIDINEIFTIFIII